MMSSEEDPDPGIECHSKGLSGSNKAKTKRVRQRVDAGEPRNSYASIPNFSSRPPSQQQQHSPGSLSLSPYHSNGFASKMLQSMYDEKGLHPLMMLDGVDRNGSSLNGTALQNPPGRLYVNGGNPICDLNAFYGGGHNRTLGAMSPDSPPTPERSSSNGSGTSSNSHLLRDILQQGRKYGGSNGGAVTPPAHVSAGPHSSKGSGVTSAGHGREEPPRPNERELTEREEEEEEVITEGESEGAGPEERRDNAGNPSETVPVRNLESPQPSHADEIRSSCNTSMMRMMSDLSPQQPPPPPVPRCSSPVSAAVLSPSVDGNTSISLAVPNQSSVDNAAVSPASSPALSCCSPRSAAATPNWQPVNSAPNASSQINNNGIASNDLEVKRARVETIVSNMLQGPAKSQGNGTCPGEQPPPVNGCKKRKLYQPQQHETCMSRSSTALVAMNGDIDESFDEDEECIREPSPKRRGTDLLVFREQLRRMQDQLVAMQQQYIDMMDRDSAEEDNGNNMHPLASPLSHVNNNGRSRHRSMNLGNDQRSPDNSDYEEHKPRILDINKETRGPLDTSRTKGIYVDYDNASLYEDQKRLIVVQDNHNKVPGATRPSHHEQSASSDDGLKSGLKDICRQSCIVQPPSCFSGSNLDYNWLAESLKAELSTSLGHIVDEVMSRCAQRKSSSKAINCGQNSTTCSEQEPAKDPTLLSQMLDRKSPRTKVIDRGARVNGHGLGAGLRASPYPQDIISSVSKPPFFSVFPFKPPTNIAAATAAFLYGSPPQLPPSLALTQPSYLSSPVHHPSASTPLSSSLDAPEQTEPVSLVVTPKKKRHKVTDTRLNPRGPLQLGGPLRNNGLNSQDSQDVSPKYSGMLSSLSTDGLTASQHLYSHHPPPPPPPLVPVSLPTSVAIPNPSLNQSDFFHGFSYDPHSRMAQYSMDHQDDDMGGPGGGSLLRNSTPTNSIHHPLLPSHGSGSGVLSHHPQRGSPDSLHYSHMKQDSGDISDAGDSPAAYDSSMPMISFLPMMHTSTLTPMHLRKAKLMFFYARYPSSAVLKMYFPDIKFNKNNTAQLVKWFSNFREFYYIQMEKYARQAMSEGIKASDDLKVTPDSELLRVLNLHYNRNNHIEAPENFRFVVEQTLREFFKALVAGKDTEQSWKKSIYKVIARLDDNVPEYFKSPNFLETLE